MKFAFPLLAAALLTALTACEPGSGKTGTPASSPPAQVQPQAQADPVSGLKWVSVSGLPREGQQIYTLIARGGPLRYSKDGATFGNREGLLPRQARGYYREYTVKTPGETDRGARRIICGGQPVTRVDDCYYTADHYNTFRRIRP